MLNARQQAFVEAYIKGGCKSATEAAVKAGYSPRSASMHAARLLKNDKVRAEIAAIREPAKEEAIVDTAFVYRELRDMAIVCGQKVPLLDPTTGEPMTDEQGRPVYKKLDPAGANAALKTLSQCLGIGKEKDKDETIGALAGALLGIINADK